MSVNIGSRGCSSGKTRVENDDFVAIELEVVVVVVIVVVPLAIHQNVFSSSSSSVSLTIIVPVVFLKQTFKYYHFLFYFVLCNNNFFFTTFLRRRGLKNSKMDFVSSLYETFSGQTLGRPNKKTKKKTPQKKSSSSQLAKKSLKSPQNAKVKKKASSKTPRAKSPLLTKVPRPNLKSITNKPLPPPSKKEKSNETSDARTTTTTTTTRETKKNAAYDVSTIQSALAKGEDLRPVMQKIETKKRAILGEIDALERETKRKKKEVVELEKALLLGANRW